MSMADDFSRVLAEAGEPEPAKLPSGVRALAELQAAVAELNASRLTRWKRNEASRQAAAEAYRLANEEAGIEPGSPPETWPWMTPPPPVRIL